MKLSIAVFILGLLLIIGGIIVKVFKIDFSASSLIIAGMMVDFVAMFLISKTFSDINKEK